VVSAARENADGPFRFATSPDRATDLFYLDLLRRIRDAVIEEAGEKRLLSLVLSGSLAMGEGCSYPAPEGGRNPGSDIDLYLVTSEGNAGELSARMRGFRERLLSALGVRGLVVDLGVTTPDRLARLKPSVANCLLARHGKVLAGDPEALRSAERPDPGEIPARDGFLLLSNRTAEDLVEFRIGPSDPAGEWAFWYRFGKTVRDIGTSALVAGGSFRPAMRERDGALPDFLRREGLDRSLPNFAGDHSFWCAQKEKPDLGAVRERYGASGAFREAHRRKRAYLTFLRPWARKKAFGTPIGAAALEAIRSEDPLRRRARSWAGRVRRNGASALPGWARFLALGFAATPLAANYEAAHLLVAASGPLTGEAEEIGDRAMLAEAGRIAPERRRPRGGFRERWLSLREDVGGFWIREVMESSRSLGPVE